MVASNMIGDSTKFTGNSSHVTIKGSMRYHLRSILLNYDETLEMKMGKREIN